MKRALERLAILVAALAIAVGVIALLSGGLLAGHDDPGIGAGQTGPGIRYRDQGSRHLRPGEPHPAYDSDPPTSGPHVRAPLPRRDRADLSDDQLLEALEVGDVVLMYGTREPPRSLPAVAEAVAGRYTPALASQGQAVILARRPGAQGVTALAWTRMLRSTSPSALRGFAQFWLGRGAPLSSATG